MTRKKQILVATDLAPCATNALRYAMQWAQHTSCSIHIYHRIEGMPAGTEDTEPFAEAIDAFQTAVAPWQKQMEVMGIAFHAVCAGGALAEGISGYADEQGIDYLFIGSHGKPAGRFKKLGSDAITLVRELRLPVLIAKESYRPEIKRVIFASNFDSNAPASFRVLLEMIAPLTPSIHLLNIDTPSFYSEPKALILPAMQALQEEAAGMNCTLHVFTDSQIDKGVLHFAEEIEADLVALGEYSDRLFGGRKMHKTVKSLILTDGLPLILIDPTASPTN